MGCGDACPNVRTDLRLDWQIPDPRSLHGKDFARIRDRVEEEVKGLLREVGR
jgi:protein-tyrosine-phosphatase